MDTAKTFANFTESPIQIDFRGQHDNLVVNDGHKISVPIWSNEFLYSERDVYVYRLEREIFRILSKGDVRNWQKFRDAFKTKHNEKALTMVYNMVEDTRVEHFAGEIWLGTGADIEKINPRVPNPDVNATNPLHALYNIKHLRMDLIDQKILPIAEKMKDLLEQVKGLTAAGTVAVATQILDLIQQYYDDPKNCDKGCSGDQEMQGDAEELQKMVQKRGDANSFKESEVETEVDIVVAKISVQDLKNLLKSGALKQMMENSRRAGDQMCKKCTVMLMDVQVSDSERAEMTQLQKEIQDLQEEIGEDSMEMKPVHHYTAEMDKNKVMDKLYEKLAAGGFLSKRNSPDPGYDRVLVHQVREMFRQIKSRTIYLPHESGNKLQIKKYIQFLCGNTSDTRFFERKRTIGGLDVRFVIDCSGSMGGSIANSEINPIGLCMVKIQAAKYLMRTFVEAIDGLPFLSIGIIAYTNDQAVNITKEHLKYLTDSGGTPAHIGLMAAYKQLYRSKYKKRLIVHISDGHPDDSEAAAKVVKIILTDRIEVYTILITDTAYDDDVYKHNVALMYGGQQRLVMVNDFANIRQVVNTMVMGRIVSVMEGI